jgi:predicted nucleic acid-binding protein
MISFDANILVYATASVPDAKALRARDLIARAMRAGWTILLLQTLAEFANVAIRKAGIPIKDIRRTIDAWRAVLPIQAADDDLAAALEAVRAHRMPFWDAMLWASAQRAGVRHLLTEDLQDGFALQGVRFVNPFERENDRLIDEILPHHKSATLRRGRPQMAP